jgi:peptidoglycan/xylan/chitin deacetylase (PgdA/CDA1 family)
MRGFFKKIIIFFCYYSGLNSIFSFFGKNKLYVLNFHSIYSEQNKEELNFRFYSNLSMSNEAFEARIKYLLDHGHTFIKTRDLENIVKKNIQKPTILYFDDGFKDNLFNALPVLKKYNIPAIVFVSTDLIDQKYILWTIEHRIFMYEQGRSDDEVVLEIKRLKKLSSENRKLELVKIYQSNNFKVDPSKFNIFLNWADLVELVKNGWEIGSHGVSHLDLTQLTDEDIKKDLLGSKKIIEEKLGQSITAFSLPYGRYNERVIKLAKESTYRVIMSSGLGLNKVGDLGSGIFFLKNILLRIDDSFMTFKVNLYSTNILRGKK